MEGSKFGDDASSIADQIGLRERPVRDAIDSLTSEMYLTEVDDGYYASSFLDDDDVNRRLNALNV